MRALRLKLLRDLWGLRGQSLAIAMVIASGVATLVMCLSTLESLRATRDDFYRGYRFAQVFAALERAPEGLAPRLADLPGVQQVQTRVMAGATLEVAGYPEPVTGQVVSLPDHGQPRLNRVYLARGRLLDPTRRDEVILSDAFAEAHGFTPGAVIPAVIRGRRQQLRVVGIARSPDYLIQLGPGDPFPDFRRFAVLWMTRSAVEAAAGLEGAFNHVSLSLTTGASEQDVIDRVDELLRPYGGLGAYGRADQLSNRYLSEEFKQLTQMARIFPAIFLSVSAFLLHVVILRLVETQRDQIAILKAFGYTNLEVARHYLGMVLLVALLGALLGVAGGSWLGKNLLELYMDYYRFPSPRWVLSPGVLAAALAVSLGAASLGALWSVRSAALLPPAEAMRPAAPARFRRSLVERLGLARLLTPAGRMMIRNLERRPLKTALSLVGIAFACAVVMIGSFFWDSVEEVIWFQFGLAQREDVTVSFVEPSSPKAAFELLALPGVRRVEPFRAVPVRLRHEQYRYRTVVTGVRPGAVLHRQLDAQERQVSPPEEGVLMTGFLARLLHLRPGDWVDVEILEGERRTRRVQVVGEVEEFIGVSCTMQLPALDRLLGEAPALSGAWLSLEDGSQERVYAALRRRPRVAAATSARSALTNLRATMVKQMLTFAFFNTLLASSIAFGVVYNAARLALSERGRELASLRVLGLTRGEVSAILLGELGVLSLCAIPLGWVLGYGLCAFMVTTWQIDLFRMPFALSPRSLALAAAVVVGSAAISALVVRRKLDHLDLVEVLKTRE